MNKLNFYDNLDLKYPEIAICLENTVTNIGKFFIPILTPTLSKKEPYYKQDMEFNVRNVVNSQELRIFPTFTSNYIELPLPKGYESANKDDKFIVIFIGGDINKPVLIGGY
ncbi:MAG: hypothetical protein PHC62_01045 [Candidatus Izemoplasmatales bacterium]|nr:hypothetical protein [Candidatus Izemoplasmatales bacterium]